MIVYYYVKMANTFGIENIDCLQNQRVKGCKKAVKLRYIINK